MDVFSFLQGAGPLAYGLGALLVVLSVSALAFALKARSLKKERILVSTCGYVAPKPTEKATNQVRRIFNFLLWIQVGKVTFEGQENVDAVAGGKILCANHAHWADVGIMPRLVKSTGRFMAHYRVMTALWGMLGVWLSRAGVFVANDNIKDGGARTREASTKMLMDGETMVIFPEGLTNFSPNVDEFKTGTVRIAREAAKRMGKPVHIVPAFIRYGKYPTAWLAKLDRAVQYFVVFFLFPIYRRKARVVVGKPISTDDFVDAAGNPLSDEAASEFLRQKVVELDPGKV